MNKTKTYTAIDFQQYYAGTMPAQDMHALEKAALEDPFLADALEGYVHTVNATVEIEKIKQKLPPYKEEQKAVVIAFNKKLWMRVAASVALFIGLGYLFFNLNDKNETKTIAKNNSEVEEKIDSNKIEKSDTGSFVTINAASEGNVAHNHINPPNIDVVIQMEPLKTTNGTTQTVPAGTYYSDDKATSTISGNEIFIAPSANAEQVNVSEKKEFAKLDDARADSINYRKDVVKSLRRDANVDNDLVSDRTPLLNNNVTQNGFNNSYNFSGVVKTPAGGPMQNATIKLRNSNIFTKTDNNGRFNFAAKDSVAVVSVIASGYANRDLTLNGYATTQPLNTSASKIGEEVVVTAMGTNAKKRNNVGYVTQISAKDLLKNSKDKDLNNELAGKVSGLNVETKENEKLKSLWEEKRQIKTDSSNYKTVSNNFKTYVTKNIIPLFDEKGNEYKGKVVLSFITNKKGAPRKIKIETSLNKKCDAQAKKLLENGPAWEINTETRNTIVIEF
jgi:hypothetical protein